MAYNEYTAHHCHIDCRTPLHWAAATGQADCVRLLLERGVSPRPVDIEGGSPLDYAQQSGHNGKERSF